MKTECKFKSDTHEFMINKSEWDENANLYFYRQKEEEKILDLRWCLDEQELKSLRNAITFILES